MNRFTGRISRAAKDWARGRKRAEVAPRPCAACGDILIRKSYGERLEPIERYRNRRFCDEDCFQLNQLRRRRAEAAA